MSVPHIEWDQPLIEKYNCSGPRYTSYPTALEFDEGYRETDFLNAVSRYPDRPLSLYLHIPFCHRLCYFCGCNKQITRQAHKAERYLDALEVEIRQRAPLFADRIVTQMHWGGGTPTFLSEAQISRLNRLLRSCFRFSEDAEISLELDPREIALDRLDHLKQEGFNRLSMGVQDFNKQVQKLVNREQDEDFIFALMARAKSLGFVSSNIDLIYGLPKQTAESFAFTLQKVLELRPDRLSVFNYAHMPALFPAQRKIHDSDLPDAAQKLEILQQSIATLTGGGYQFIGMDHFALPEDELAVAQRQGVLHRNFQGYTTQGNTDLLGLGVSAISMIGDTYAQNHKVLNQWHQSVAQQGHALWRGVSLDNDDRLRRDLILRLICHFSLDIPAFEQQWQIDFAEYFAEDLQLLQPLADDGLVTMTSDRLAVTPRGRLLIRNICMCFDRYLRNTVRQQQFSRVI